MTAIKLKNKYSEFDGWMLPKQMLDYLKISLPKHKTILEFGSGNGTKLLLDDWNVISIENNKKWAIKRKSSHIHVMIRAKLKPISVDGWDDKEWYDEKIVRWCLAMYKYDVVIIDGPNGATGRAGIVNNIIYMNKDVPILMDDLQKPGYIRIFEKLAKGKQSEIITLDWEHNNVRKFGVIHGKKYF